MTKINSLAMIAAAIYLIAVVYHGKQNELTAFIMQQKAFVKWAVSFFVLLLIYEFNPNNLTGGLIAIAFVAMLLNANESGMIDNFNNAIQKLLKV